MTGRGIAYGIGLLVLLLWALGTGISELYLIVACLLLVLLLSLAAALLAAGTLHGRPALSPPQAMRGDTVTMELPLAGRLLLPVQVHLRVESPEGAIVPEHAALPEGTPSMAPATALDYPMTLFPWNKTHTLTLSLRCVHRGVWPVGVSRLRVYDPLGLFVLPLLRRDAAQKLCEPLTVYPILYELDGEWVQTAVRTDDSSESALAADHGDSFAGTRLYRDGDSLKRIHWKQSLRTRELHTRQYERSTEAYTLLLLDTAVFSDTQRAGYADMACECAAALALLYTVQHQPVRLLCTDWEEDGNGVVQGPEEFAALYTQLATVPFTVCAAPLLPTMLHNAALGQVRALYVFSCRPGVELLDTLRQFAQRPCPVAYISPLPLAPYDAALLEEDGVHTVTVARPEDILAVLGDCL